jgi:undecaprenyl-diphosphatase
LALYHILVLAIVQGVTEFLPISSSGHLVLTSKMLNWPDQGLLIDVAVHVGTLFAVMVYFWRDLWGITVGIVRLFAGRRGPGAGLAGQILMATIPIVIAGYFGRDYIGTYLRDVEIIAWSTIGFGILLWIADHLGMTVRRIEHLKFGNVIFIGLAQVLALIPGTSRSGITMTAGRFLGMERMEAARFSMLLSIPTILGAGVLAATDLGESGDFELGQDVILSAGIAFIAGLLSIVIMMQWLSRAGFTPFILYRLALGAGLLYWIYAAA